MSAPSEVDPQREVTRLHIMLEDWYGRIREDIDPIEAALAPDFTWIDADGILHNRSEALSAWESERSRLEANSFAIDIEVNALETQRSLYGVHQLTFRKTVQVPLDNRTLSCSLWLRETERIPSGLQWLHLQETPVTEPESTRE